MSDRDADEANGDQRRSDAGRSSRFREVAARLDDEAGEHETGADTAAETDRVDSHTGKTGNADDSRERTAGDAEAELSRRTGRDGDDDDDDAGGSEKSDSWEWIDTEDGEEASTETEDDSGSGATDAEPTATDAESVSTATDAESVSTATDAESVSTATDAESVSTASDRRERNGRIWDSQTPSAETPVDSSSDDGPVADVDAASPAAEGFADAAAAEPAADALENGVDLTPGTAVLVESGSQDERTGTTCQRLLHDDLDRSRPSVILVRYQRIDPEELRRIATEAARLKLVSVGYAQDVPGPIEDSVETVKITNPNDITRLGIVVSGTIDQWSDADGDISFCYDSINVLLNYKDVKSTFRFLHVLLRTLRRGDAVSHFHADPLAGNPQSINTLKPLFDEIISIDSMGMTVE